MMNEQNLPEHQPPPLPEKGKSKALTIPAKRLKGSSCCLNCGTELKGPFCYYCGQPDKNFMRFFPVLVRELMADFLDLDSRFMRTMKPLMFHPGKLTRDYLDGRRFRYTPPLRLYIFTSMAFFILAAMLAGSAIKINAGDGETGLIHIGVDDDEELAKVRQKLNELEPGLADKLNISVEEATATDVAVADARPDAETKTNPEAEPKTGPDTEDDSIEIQLDLDGEDDGNDEISFNDKPWDRETNPVIIPLMPEFINEWINDEIEESPQKGKEIEANPNLIIDKIFDVLPATTFILLPLVALLFKFWYLFSRRYYVEHLILALHNHSFLFVIFLLSMLSNSLAGWIEPSEEGRLTTAVMWFNIALFTWAPIYFLLSLKRVYQQSWTLTGAKYLVIGLSYLMLLGLTTAVAAALSFVLL
jgi:hypothetical protein